MPTAPLLETTFFVPDFNLLLGTSLTFLATLLGTTLFDLITLTPLLLFFVMVFVFEPDGLTVFFTFLFTGFLVGIVIYVLLSAKIKKNNFLKFIVCRCKCCTLNNNCRYPNCPSEDKMKYTKLESGDFMAEDPHYSGVIAVGKTKDKAKEAFNKLKKKHKIIVDIKNLKK